MNLIEKYKPKNLSDLVLPNEKVRFLLEDIADGLVVNHLLLTGTQGAQKTTIAKLARLSTVQVVIHIFF